MRFPRLPSNTRFAPQRLGGDYGRLVFDRALLLWLHIVLGFAAAFTYLSTIDHSRLTWWGRVGIYLLLQSTPSWIPYVISGVFSRRRLPARRAGVWLFVTTLLAGTAAVGYLYLTSMLDQYPILGVVVIQTAAYVAAASAFLGREIDE